MHSTYIYLDNAATTFPKPPAVIDAMSHFMRSVGASPNRSAHFMAVEASRVCFETRERLAALFGVRNSSRIVFTSNATEAINAVLFGFLRYGDRVVTSSIEHNAVMRPLRHLEQTRGVIVDIVRCCPTGEIDLSAFSESLKRRARLVVITHGSNVTGAIAPLEEISRYAHEAGASLLVDAAQTAGIRPINVEKSNIEFLAFSGHKSLYGPQGIGGLYIAEGIELPPLRYGGTGSNSESEEQPRFMPDIHESGTLNGPGIAGLGAGVDFILREGIDRIAAHEQYLTRLLIEGLRDIPGIRIYGPADPSRILPIVSITIAERDNSVVARCLSDERICVRAGLLCAPAAHRTIGTMPHGTIRLSIGYFNKADDVNKAIEVLKRL